MSVADSRHLLALSVAATAADAPAGSGGIALLLQARHLDDARSELRHGETVSVSA
jgi:hypothetical protein